MRHLSGLLLLLCAVACSQPAAEAPPTSEDASEPQILEPWAQVLPNGVGAVYLSIRNPGDEPERLVAVEAADAVAAETHESVDDGGVMRMVAHPDGFEIPAGGTLSLEPGGKHVMLIEPRLPEGAESVRLTLRFEKAPAVVVDAPLVEMGGGMDHGGMDHGDMDHGDMDHGGMDHGDSEPEGMEH